MRDWRHAGVAGTRELLLFYLVVILWEIQATPCGGKKRVEALLPSDSLSRTASVGDEGPLLHSVQLDEEGRIQMSWTPEPEHVVIQVQAAALGYVGVGISPTGGMRGADIILCWVDDNGNVNLTDRHGEGSWSPALDASQDVRLLSGGRNATHTTCRFRRPWTTCDRLHDLPITSDTTRVIYALSDTQPDPAAATLPHHSLRGTRSLYLQEARVLMPLEDEGVLHWDVFTPDVSLPANHSTLYWCSLHRTPPLHTKHHHIASEPLISKDQHQLVHHMILYECVTEGSGQLLERYVGQQGAQCYSSNMPLSWWACRRPFVAWSVGGEGEAHPPHVGTPLGEDWGGATYFLLEVHYNNPRLLPGLRDSSGLRLYYTSHLREFDLGLLELGVPVSPPLVISPLTPNFSTVGHCTPACTSQTLPQSGVKVLAGLLHSHLLGRAITVQHLRGGKELPPILHDEHYDFNYQQQRRVEPEVTVLPGDHLIVTCRYDSSQRPLPTFGGLDTEEEMCLAYLTVYPRPALAHCQSTPDPSALYASLGVLSVQEDSAMNERQQMLGTLESLSEEERKSQLSAMEEMAYQHMMGGEQAEVEARRVVFSDQLNAIKIREPLALQNLTILELLRDRELWSDADTRASFQAATSRGDFVPKCTDGADTYLVESSVQQYPVFEPYVAEERNCTR